MDPNALVSQDTLHQYRPLQPRATVAGDYIINGCVPDTRECMQITEKSVFEKANGIGSPTPTEKSKDEGKNAKKEDNKEDKKAGKKADKKPDQEAAKK